MKMKVVGTIIHLFVLLMPFVLGIGQAMNYSAIGVYYGICLMLCLVLKNDILSLKYHISPIRGTRPTKEERKYISTLKRMELRRNIVTYLFLVQLLIVSTASLVMGVFGWFDSVEFPDAVVHVFEIDYDNPIKRIIPDVVVVAYTLVSLFVPRNQESALEGSEHPYITLIFYIISMVIIPLFAQTAVTLPFVVLLMFFFFVITFSNARSFDVML